jgi:hypothetical protein
MAVRRILEILEFSPARSREIAKAQGTSASSSCTELARMLAYRLVKLTTSPWYRRRRIFAITERGRQRLAWYRRNENSP